jgi:nucleoside-diphosphate-sugar epimerase
MKVFVTGATGFIGSHLVPKLIARGYNVTCVVRDPKKAGALAKQGATLVAGDVTDRESMREPMRGSDAVFHLAGWYAFGVGRDDVKRMVSINVDGARNPLELAFELGVPKIVHTSTVGVFGNTHGRIVDETYRVGKEAMGSEYERTKWIAHHEIAVPLQQRGAPIVIVQPGGVSGPGDTSPHTEMYRYFFRRTPVMFGAKSGLTWAHVDDIAEGHILAMQKGKEGETYIIAGPAMTYKESMQAWEKITGIPAPKVWLPGWVASGMAKLVEVLEHAFGLRMTLSSEVLGSLADYTFWASAEKAKRELGWQPRPVEETFRETLEEWRKSTRRK